MGQSPTLSQILDFSGIANQNDISHLIREDAISGFQGSFLRSFGEDNALLISFSTRDNVLN